MEYVSRGGAGFLRGWSQLLVLVAASLLAASSYAQPWPATSCAGDRNIPAINKPLGCTSNDINIASVTVNNANSCIAGTTVNLSLTVNLQVNATNRYDVGVFIANDGKDPTLAAQSGGGASCSVFSTPFSPSPFADTNGNACGDIGSATGPVSFTIPTPVPVLCVADASGNLSLPAVVTWANSSGSISCPSNPAVWVEAETTSKCNLSFTTSVPVVVLGSITINKDVVGADSTFNYTGTGFTLVAPETGDPPFSITTTGGTGQHVISGLGTNNATYTVTESPPGGGYSLTGLTCTGGTTTTNLATGTATITLTPGSPNATCTYTNSQGGSITINKTTVGGDGTFNYTDTSTATAISPFAITTVGGAGSKGFASLAAGTYTVTETVPAGWNLTGLTCGAGGTPNLATGTVTIVLPPGGTVACTYTDTKQGSITIDKVAQGGDGTFNYTGTGTGISPFSITTVSGTGSHPINGLAPGAYTITESAPTGFNLTGLGCTGGGTTTNLATGTATINLAAGAAVVCTYTNTKQGSITINKTATGGNSTFNFTSTVPGNASFSITTVSGSGSKAISGVVPGTYTVTETVPAGWSLSTLTCVDPTSDSTGNVGTATATINLAAGESVSCTFTDAIVPGTITINKTTTGGNSTFNFTSTVPANASFSITTVSGSGNKVMSGVAPGTYTVTESVPSGWSLVTLTCSDPTSDSTGNVSTATATINLAAAESVSCTFTDNLPAPPPPPPPTIIPTLGEWALIMLAMLLLVTGWLQYRRRR